MDKRTDIEKENDARFANRRKMAFWSLYAILFISLATTIKILIITSTEVDVYTPILSWGLSVLGGVVLAYIGAAAYEQSSGKVKLKTTDDDESDDSDNNDDYRPRRYRDKFIDGQTTADKPKEFEGN